jgi:mandelate racemase
MKDLKVPIRDVTARTVLVPLNRPVATKVGEFAEWPSTLIDLHTEEGITGRGYLARMRKRLPGIDLSRQVINFSN